MAELCRKTASQRDEDMADGAIVREVQLGSRTQFDTGQNGAPGDPAEKRSWQKR
jgi:hypothetical protein